MASFTGPRAEQYEYLKYLMRHRYIELSVYYTEKTKLHKQETAVIKRRAAAEQRKIVRAAQRKAQAQAKRQATLAAKKLKLTALSQVDSPVGHDAMFGFFEPIRSRDVRILVFNKATQELHLDTLMSVPETYDRFRQQLMNQLGAGSDIEADIITGSKFVAVLPQTTEAKRLIQSFRDGIQHCVFTPIFKLMEQRLHAAGEGSAKRYKQRINRLHELQQQYLAGVPEEEMETVAKAAGLKVIILDVLGNAIMTFNEAGKVGTLYLSNTRANHVEVGMVVRSDPEEVDLQRLIDILHDCRDSKVHYEFEGDLRNGVPRRINTLNGSYVLADPEREAYAKFDEEIGVFNRQLNATKYPELNEFLKAGRIINGWSCPLGNDDETGCLDLKQAYAQFKHAPLYAGFLGKVHQFRSGSFDEAFMREHIGFYRITITSEPPLLAQYLGLYQGLTTVLFSQEILMWASHGITFTSDMGAWGERFDFTFPEYMLENRRYAIWAGRLGADRTHRNVTMPATSEFADHVKSYGHDVLYWKDDGMMTVKLPNNNRFTAHHILGAITAYTRMNMVQAMLQFQPEQLCRVVMDGIYYKGVAPTLPNFHEKPVAAEMSSMCWYAEAATEITAPPMAQIIRDSFLGGQGGAGKTYAVLTDPGFIDPMIVTPCHVLGKDAHEKYSVPYTTIHKLIGLECTPYRMERRIPGVIVLDEITQYDAANVDRVRKMYPECLFVGVGDISREGNAYQCRTGDGNTWSTVWKPTGVDYIEYTTDRRSLDADIAALKLRIRQQMDTVRGADETVRMTMWAKANLPQHQLDFQPGDVCIAGTHRTNKKLLADGIISGYYKKGGHVSNEAQPGFEQRGSFTIHSFQGRTIENGRIFIFLDDMFEISMLYTAVSRARRIDQLRFIHRY